MRLRTAHALRIATFAVFAAVAALLLGLAFDSTDSPAEPEVAQPEAGAVTVADVVGGVVAADATVSVRGFLFEGGGTGVRLCHRRRPGKPPQCLGPFLDVYDLDLKGLPLRRGVSVGRPVRWLDQPVTIYGHVLGTALSATSISR